MLHFLSILKRSEYKSTHLQLNSKVLKDQLNKKGGSFTLMGWKNTDRFSVIPIKIPVIFFKNRTDTSKIRMEQFILVYIVYSMYKNKYLQY